jgi:hypothetical protein
MYNSGFITIFIIVEMTLIVTYIALIGYLIRYLRRVHTAMWVELGRPSLWITINPFDLVGQFRLLWTMARTFVFILVSFQYATLNDTRLTKLIWSTRFLLVVCGFLWPGMRIFQQAQP